MPPMSKLASFAIFAVLSGQALAGDCKMEKSGGTCTASCSTGLTLSLICGETSCVSSCTDQKAGSAGYFSNVYRDMYLAGGAKSSKSVESFFTEDFKSFGGGPKPVTIDNKKFNILISPSVIDSLPKGQRYELTQELGKFSAEDFMSPKRFEIQVEKLKK
jgi:hypothetical protein